MFSISPRKNSVTYLYALSTQFEVEEVGKRSAMI